MGYRVLIPRDKILVVTQHVRNVKKLTNEKNSQLRIHLDDVEILSKMIAGKSSESSQQGFGEEDEWSRTLEGVYA